MVSPVKIWRNQSRVRSLLGKEGQIISWTTVYVPAAEFVSSAPYVVVLVQLDGDRRYTAQLVDWDERHLAVGQRVKAVLRRTREPGEESVIPYGVKFKPIS